MVDRTTALERLEQLLDEKDERIATLETELRNLRRQHEGEFGGLLDHNEIPDDETLPIPRLEVVYTQDGEYGWQDTRVVYRIVYKHLSGALTSVPLGVTRIRSGSNAAPSAGELPFRDGCHAHHDAALFGWPLFRIVDGGAPEKLSDGDYAPQRDVGNRHRRGAI